MWQNERLQQKNYYNYCRMITNTPYMIIITKQIFTVLLAFSLIKDRLFSTKIAEHSACRRHNMDDEVNYDWFCLLYAISQISSLILFAG
jgi:hypothetical protein